MFVTAFLSFRQEEEPHANSRSNIGLKRCRIAILSDF